MAEGLSRTSAGLGSVIIDSQPLTVAVLAALLFGERLGPKAVGGLALGVAGLLLLNVPVSAIEAAAGGHFNCVLIYRVVSVGVVMRWWVWGPREAWWLRRYTRGLGCLVALEV